MSLGICENKQMKGRVSEKAVLLVFLASLHFVFKKEFSDHS